VTPAKDFSHGHATIKFGNPLLEAPPTGLGPEAAPTCCEVRAAVHFRNPRGQARQVADPYAELRWPAYALTSFELANPDAAIATLDVSVNANFCRLRAK